MSAQVETLRLVVAAAAGYCLLGALTYNALRRSHVRSRGRVEDPVAVALGGVLWWLTWIGVLAVVAYLLLSGRARVRVRPLDETDPDETKEDTPR